jgi:LPXTG-motif cell wall-anchored protein
VPPTGPTTTAVPALPVTGPSQTTWMTALGTLGLALGLVMLAVSRRTDPVR